MASSSSNGHNNHTTAIISTSPSKGYHDKRRPSSQSQFILRGLKSTYGGSRTNDDVHSSINLCPVTFAILDTPHMQRLRGLKQLGVSEVTYIATTHNRFEHSLGVGYLADSVLKSIREKQPQLNITDKDILCVKLAGILHDIGHGPFSHMYDGELQNLLKKAMADGQTLGQEFDVSAYNDYPEKVQGWKHEDGSLMMIYALLAHLGLEIDFDELDEPLRQIGDGIDARKFGHCGHTEENGSFTFYDGDSILPPDSVLTSRDWIFIMECVIGGPLPPEGQSIKSANNGSIILEYVGREDPYKEFLYDIVANRHSGLDVDKIDYLARDDRRAFKTAGEVDRMLLEHAYVAWGKCPDQQKCFKCRHLHMEAKPSTDKREGMHLMICYPEKMVHVAMGFFKARFKNHQKLYTHPTTKSAEYMLCDILLLADPYVKLSTYTGDNKEVLPSHLHLTECETLPISRAMLHPNAYVKLKDSILDIIATSDKKELKPAQKLLRRYQSRKLYKKVAEEAIVSGNHGVGFGIDWHKKIWDMTESEIVEHIVKCSKLKGDGKLCEYDVIVEKREIHHGKKASNPVASMRFLPKSQLTKLREDVENLPEGKYIGEEEYECSIPRVFLQRTLRVFSRDPDHEKCQHLEGCYHQFIDNTKKQYSKYQHREENNGNFMPAMLSQSPPRGVISNDAWGLNNTCRGSYGEEEEEEERQPKKQRRSLFGHLDVEDIGCKSP